MGLDITGVRIKVVPPPGPPSRRDLAPAEPLMRERRAAADVGDRRFRQALEGHFLPGAALADERAQQLVVERVAGLVAAEFADQAVSEQIQIADRIENLVLDELVLVAQAVLVEHAVVVEHDGVVHVAAEREIARPQALQIAHEAEGARTAHFAQEGGGREIHRGNLRVLLEGRMIEFDLEIDLEAVVGIEARPLVAVLDLQASPECG